MVTKDESEDALVEYMAKAYMNETAKNAIMVLETEVNRLSAIIAEAQTLLWKAKLSETALNIRFDGNMVEKAIQILIRGLKK